MGGILHQGGTVLGSARAPAFREEEGREEALRQLREADLIVIPTHGRTGLRRFLIGSVAEKVVRTAPCPVFVAKSFGKRLVNPPKPTEEAADVPNVFPHPAARASE